MPTRLPACNPCKASKLSCDHVRPVCGRCQDRNQPDNCVYRARPFKRKHTTRTRPKELTNQQHTPINLPGPTRDGIDGPINSHTYPNPGYLGSSSHAKIFKHIPHNVDAENSYSGAWQESHISEQNQIAVDYATIAYGAKIIEEIRDNVSVLSCGRLVSAWTSKGVNLALAGSLVKKCTETVAHVFNGFLGDSQEATHISRSLFMHSGRPLAMESASTFDRYCDSFCLENARWETIGLFFTAVSRATIDETNFDVLYSNEQQRRRLRKLATRFSDLCIDIAISLDCLNDLQLLLQYENFINHSIVDGDQSYHSWRRLGDVASSIFALGYHEQIDSSGSAPSFVRNWRWAAFARAYSGDKNVSIFLGRPPRIQRKYCQLAVPCLVNNPYSSISESTRSIHWTSDEEFDYMADTQWSFLCALRKEEALDLFHEKDYHQRTKRARDIQADVEADWTNLPTCFRLETTLKLCSQKPVERDFMVSTRLNHLHVLFLVRLALVRRVSEPDSDLISVAASILSLAVEAALLKEQLANSGTGVVWKVAYYGLPAAGIICLSLVNQSFINQDGGVSRSKIYQDLSVLVAQVETGALIGFQDPNYALLSGATRTIKALLDKLVLNGVPRSPEPSPASNITLEPFPTTNHINWDFEVNFWEELAEHPFLVGNENQSFDLF